jgi:hypothetical protein
MATNAAPEPAAGPAVSPRALSAELAALKASVAGKAVELRAVLEALQGRAYELLMILLVLPFAVPVAVPGMSTPLGIVIGGIALQLAFGRLPWLPRRLLAAKLPAGFLDKVLAATQGVVRFLEKFLRPRLRGLTGSRGLVGLHLWAIALAAFLVALPLPIPFTNMIPGWAILLIAMGLMERDGLFIAAGHVVLVISVAYFALIGGSAQHTIEWAIHWVKAWLAR